MSINKLDDLSFEHIFLGGGDRNDNHNLDFTKDGLEIYYDTLRWEDIKVAYRKLFKEELENKKRDNNPASVTRYIPSMDEIKAFTPMQARGFIIGNLTLEFVRLGVSIEQACQMTNIILTKVIKED